MHSEEPKREPRKQCSKCQDYKLVSEFFKEKSKPMGLQSRCKLCHKAGVKNWRAEKRAEVQQEGVMCEEAEAESGTSAGA